jgi:proteasome lid subunit RPN8/RPN11
VSPTTLLLPTHVRETLVAHAEDGAPEEVCGVLLGTDRGSDTIRVTDTGPVANVADDPRTRYELAPAETAQVFASVDADDAAGDGATSTAETDATEVVGFYHSHPRGPAGPSATDRAQAQWPGYVYLIVSLDGEQSAEVGAWRWTGGAFDPLSVRIDDAERLADGNGDTGSP